MIENVYYLLSQTRFDLMIGRINITLTSRWLVEGLDLVEIFKIWL